MEKTTQETLSTITRLETTLSSIEKVMMSPGFKTNGFSAFIMNNNKIELRSSPSSEEFHSVSLSEIDSLNIVRILRISTTEQINELKGYL